jgi:hypothetical protein
MLKLIGSHAAILGCIARGCQREDEQPSRKPSRMKLIAASGGVYSAFAVGTVFADSLNVLLVQDNAGTSASMEELPEGSGVGTWVVLSGALALMSCGIGAIASVPARPSFYRKSSGTEPLAV